MNVHVYLCSGRRGCGHFGIAGIDSPVSCQKCGRSRSDDGSDDLEWVSMNLEVVGEYLRSMNEDFERCRSAQEKREEERKQNEEITIRTDEPDEFSKLVARALEVAIDQGFKKILVHFENKFGKKEKKDADA